MSGAAMAPFWRADARDRDFALSEKVGAFLAALDGRLEAGAPVLVVEFRCVWVVSALWGRHRCRPLLPAGSRRYEG